MTKEEIEARLTVLDAQSEALKAEQTALRQQLAELTAVFKIGDIVTYPGARLKWCVCEVKMTANGELYYLCAKIKANGLPSTHPIRSRLTSDMPLYKVEVQ